jgi:hypothetical protein
MSGIYITNHKIISTKHGRYINIITEDYDIYNLNIDKNIESYDKSYNLTKNIYRKIRNFKKKFIIHDDKKQLLTNNNNI